VLPTCYVSLTAAELKKVRSHNIGSYIGDIRGTGDSMVGKPLLQIASDTLSQSFFLFVFWCLFVFCGSTGVWTQGLAPGRCSTKSTAVFVQLFFR
jgi:hypothetical protein